MKNTRKRLICLALVLSMLIGLFAGTAVAATTDAAVYDITVNDLTEPMGIDDPTPSFSWKMDSDAIGAAQTAYNIVVTDPTGKIMWDTDWVETNDSFAIQYAGETLASSTEYTVAVKIKDQNGVATEAAATTFETGLYEEDAFDNTQWIRFNEGEVITTYTIDFDFKVERIATGFAFGMTSTSDLVMWQINTNGTNLRFRPHVRSGGSWVASKTVDLGETFGKSADYINKDMHMTIKVNGTTVETWLGLKGGEMKQLETYTLPKVYPMANWGIRAYGAKSETSLSNQELSYYDNIVFTDANGEVIYSEDFSGEDPVKGLTANYDGHSIVDGQLYIGKVYNNTDHFYMAETGMVQNENVLNKDSAPVFRKEVDVKADLVSAKLYTSGLGVYENYVNGVRVGHLQDDGSYIYDELKPGYTLYSESIFYSTFDVTHLLTEGENVLSSVVTTGWWNAASNNSNQDGVNNAYFAKLILTYADGTKEEVNTDTTWMTAKAGPMLYATGIFPGERYDATQDTSWMLPGYDDHQWKPALINDELDLSESLRAWDGPQTRVWPEKERTPVDMYTYTNVENVVYDTDGTTVLEYGKVVKDGEYEDGEDIVLKKGQTLVVDFQQNGAGWEEITFTAPAGTTLTMLRGEIINDGNGSTARNMNGPEGSVRHLSTSSMKNTYKTATDETVTWHPYLTYCGFSCMSITANADITIHKVRGQVLTSAYEDTADMETSDKDVNKLLSNIKWGLYSNFVSIPTDCPQRGERLGWTADAQVFSIAGMILSGSKAFYEKYVMDIVQSQRTEPGEYYGSYDQISPSIRIYYEDGQGATGWGDAGIIIPYNLYKMYGDTEIVEEVWDSMCIYMDDYLGPREYGPRGFYDDWMGYESKSQNTKNMNSLSFFCWDALMMAEMAAAIGKPEDAEKYMQVYENRKAQYQAEFVKEDGTIRYFSQCGALYALYVDLLPNEESVAAVTKQLIDNIEACGNRLQTGFLGTAIFLPTLTKIGRSDMAYKLLLQHENPSWLFAVDNGATTTWERWNTYSYEVGYPTTSMSSMNHYAYGAVAGWMYQGMAGISPNEDGTGYQNMVLAPQPDRSLPMVNAYYDSVYGRIVSNMNYEGTAWNYNCTVPANTTATIKLPLEADDCIVTVNGKTPDAVTLAADGIEYVETVDNTMIFRAVAGSFSFTSDRELVEIKKDAANEALNALKVYQHTAAVTEENVDTVTELINAAKTAVADYVAEGGDVSALTGYGWIAGAEAACVANAKYLIDQYTIDYTFQIVEDCSQLAFGIKDTNNLLMWQINVRTEESANTRLRKHIKTNGGYSAKTAVNLNSAIGTPEEALGKVIDVRIEVNGAEVKTYMAPTGEELVLVDTYNHSAPVTLYNVGFRSHSANQSDLEVCLYDNIVVKDANGSVLLSEDFSDPSKVGIGGTSNATDYSFVDGQIQIGNGNTSSEQIYILGTVIEEASPADVAKAAAEKALAELAPYQSTVAVDSTNKTAVQTLIDNAKAAVAAYEELGGNADALNMALVDGAEAAMVADALYQTDNYSIELTTVIESAAQGFAFGMSDVKNFIMWQLNVGDTTANITKLRPHIQVNGGWKSPSQNNINMNDYIGAPADAVNKTIYERIEVNGTEIKTYLGFDPDNMVLANTFTHSSAVTLKGIGARVDTTNTSKPELATYDNIVIRDGDGNLIYSEDFSNPENVAITGNANATAYAFDNGVLRLGSTAKLTEQRYRIGKANAFETGVEVTEARIEAIGEVTTESRTAIDGAWAAYNVLTDAQKAAVSNLAVLEAAEEAYEAAVQAAADKAAAEAVDAQIAAIGEVTVDSKAAIDAARAAYEALTDAQKALVENLAVLETAEAAYAELTKPVLTDVTLALTGEELTNVYAEEVVYTVSAADMVNLATATLTIDVDDAYLTDPAVEALNGWYIIAQTYDNGKLTVVMGNNAGANGAGDLLTVTLKPTGEPGDATVAVTAAVLSAYDGNVDSYVNAVLEGASVTTKVDYSVYDVNKDGVVNQLDLTRAQRYFGTDFADADVNDSGLVDVNDLILILNNFSNLFV